MIRLIRKLTDDTIPRVLSPQLVSQPSIYRGTTYFPDRSIYDVILCKASAVNAVSQLSENECYKWSKDLRIINFGSKHKVREIIASWVGKVTNRQAVLISTLKIWLTHHSVINHDLNNL